MTPITDIITQHPPIFLIPHERLEPFVSAIPRMSVLGQTAALPEKAALGVSSFVDDLLDGRPVDAYKFGCRQAFGCETPALLDPDAGAVNPASLEGTHALQLVSGSRTSR